MSLKNVSKSMSLRGNQRDCSECECAGEQEESAGD
jgi:hypothetical protein